MPIPESSVTSPEVEVIDPEWEKNTRTAREYLSALIYGGEKEKDAALDALLGFWVQLDEKENKNQPRAPNSPKR